MTGAMIGFCVWCAVCVLFIAIGIYAHFTKKTMGFWANAKVFEVNDVKKYNRAVGRLFIIFGVGMMILGLPLLAGQNSPLILLSVIGTMFLVIGIMVYYTLAIEKKYKKK